ncbi:MAG: 7TM-DISM domain-containing protein [Leptospiraceae bacterium]|nr:7TM-DISM domain-containing protein [Leptospiraceae bacterium]MCK6380526.1 7TM-DISM domain-containing protein [Leptospiraceae bacterium]NUM42727.1 7TM-DISM domain-containing protein [Leptospiraceae bacterium]
MNSIVHSIRKTSLLKIFSIAFVFFFITSGCKKNLTTLEAPGKLDATDVDLNKEVLDLNGSWEFYWEKLLYPNDFNLPNSPIPDGYTKGLKSWNSIETKEKKIGSDGYATYRLRVQLPKNSIRLGIRISAQNTSFRLFVNKKELALSGIPGKNKAETIHARTNRTIYFQPNTDELEIILHVANYYFFRGGLRGFIQIGSSELIENVQNRRYVFDLVLSGFGIYIWLYHIFLFLQRPKDRSILYFILLSGSFLPRYFLISERTLSLLITEVPFDLNIRMLHSLHVMTPSLLLLFMHSIFPEFIKFRTVLYFLLSTLLYFFTWFFSPQVYTSMFLFYSVGATFAALIPISFALFQSLKLKIRGAIFQSLGILFFVVLLVFAFSGVLQAESSGFMAILGFTSLSFFQSLFLSVSYTEKMQTNLVMAEQLQESKEALKKQREELELNFHDALGGSLTDLKIFTERIRKEIPKKSWSDAIWKLDKKISDIIQTFRSQLLFMEDMEFASSELFTGLHLALLRRYSDAGRELNFTTSGIGLTENTLDKTNAWIQLFFLVMEICTNDLKYGIGESKWKIIRKENDLFIHQENTIAKLKKEIFTPGKRTKERTELLGGNINAVITKNRLKLEIHLPKFWR